MKEIVIPFNKVKSFSFLCVFLGMSLFATFGIPSNSSFFIYGRIFGWAGIACSCLGILALIFQMLRNKPMVVISEKGFFYLFSAFSVGGDWIRWEEIVEMRLYRNYNQKVLGIILKNRNYPFKTRNPIVKLQLVKRAKEGRPIFEILESTLGISLDELVRDIKESGYFKGSIEKV